jgi:hypothetical protein
MSKVSSLYRERSSSSVIQGSWSTRRRIPCNPHTTLPSLLPRFADTPIPIVQIVEDKTFFGKCDGCPLVAQ